MTMPAAAGAGPGGKKPGPLAWAKKHPAGAAAAAGGAGLGGYVLYRRNQANAAAAGAAGNGTAATDTTTAAGDGTLPATFDGGGGGDTTSGSDGYTQLEQQLQALQQQLSTGVAAQNPPPGTNWYQMAKSLLQKSGDANPTVKQIDKERSKLLRVLGPASPKTPPKTPPKTKTRVIVKPDKKTRKKK